MLKADTNKIEIDNSKDEAHKNLNWNFAMGLFHGIFIKASEAFNNPSIVLPLFLDHFHLSRTMIGLFSAIFGPTGGGMAGALPQFFVASKMESKSKKKPLLNLAVTIRAVCWGLIALVAYFFAVSSPGITVSSLLVLLLVFTFMGGVAVVPMLDIWAKSIPADSRGRFFGLRNLLGSIMAICAGFGAKWILGNDKIIFPYNFALMFFLAFLFMSISYLALGSTREPKEEVRKKSLPFGKFLQKIAARLKSDKNFRNFLIVQILNGAGALAFPFYVLYAKDVMKTGQNLTGYFIVAQITGGIFSNFIWTHFSDKMGSKKVLEISTFVGFLIPLAVFLLPMNLNVMFVPLFFLIGFSMAGRKVGNAKFSLDIAPQKDRLVYISSSGTFKFPTMVFPLLGGIISQFLSYRFLFITTFILLTAAYLLTLKLEEPTEAANLA